MSTNQQALLVDTTRAISSTNSPVVVLPMQYDPSVIAPGGKWYMVYVPPGGNLPISPIPSLSTTKTTSSSSGVSVQEATSSSEAQSSTFPAVSTSQFQIANEPPRPQRVKAPRKWKREWRERIMVGRQSQTMMSSHPNPSFYQSTFLPQPKCTCSFVAAKGYQSRPFCRFCSFR